MFLKTDINSGINFLAFGPAGFLNDQQYGSVWAFWKCYLSTINTKEPLKTLPNPLGPGPYGKKFTDLRWMNDHSLFTNLMYKLDLGEFPNTTISYLRWKEHSPKTLSSGHSLSTRSLQTPKKKGSCGFRTSGISMHFLVPLDLPNFHLPQVSKTACFVLAALVSSMQNRRIWRDFWVSIICRRGTHLYFCTLTPKKKLKLWLPFLLINELDPFL